MKVLGLLLLSVLIFSVSDPILQEEYLGARSGNERESLKLYKDGGYSYHYWMHLGYYLADTGNYIKKDTMLILKSLSSKTGNTRSFSKKKHRNEKVFTYFNSDTLVVEENKICMLSKEDLQTKKDSIRICRRALYRRN
jgi:hypothetical protein